MDMEQFEEYGRWRSSKTLQITKEGKHELEFPQEFPLNVDCYHFLLDHHLTPNYHDYLEITYVYEGSGLFQSGSEKYPLSKGDLLVVGNSELHWFETGTSEPLNMVAIFFLPELIYKPVYPSGDFDFIRFFYDRSHDFSNFIPAAEVAETGIPELIQEIYSRNLHKHKHYRLYIKNLLRRILLVLLEYYEARVNGPLIETDKKIKNIDRLRDVFSLIETSYQDKITLEEAANTVNMSTHYFCKFFKKVTGLTFTEYILRVRIDKAKELLLKNRLSITQIAYEVGFESSSYFHKVFRKLTQLNPKQYMEKVVQKN